jgi:hypothetical protein
MPTMKVASSVWLSDNSLRNMRWSTINPGMRGILSLSANPPLALEYKSSCRLCLLRLAWRRYQQCGQSSCEKMMLHATTDGYSEKRYVIIVLWSQLFLIARWMQFLGRTKILCLQEKRPQLLLKAAA